jgi:hypothetical protein
MDNIESLGCQEFLIFIHVLSMGLAEPVLANSCELQSEEKISQNDRDEMEHDFRLKWHQLILIINKY